MALPNVAIQSFPLFKKLQNKENSAAGRPTFRRQALGVFAACYFFFSRKDAKE
jgi:hypothetical protein